MKLKAQEILAFILVFIAPAIMPGLISLAFLRLGL